MAERVLFLRADPERLSPGHHPRNAYPSMNIRYSASVAMAMGYDVEVIDMAASLPSGTLAESVAAAQPDTVVCDVITPAVKFTLDAVERIGVPVLAMGQHPSALPRTLLENDGPVDGCIVGEAEHTLQEALPAIMAGDLSSLAGMDGLVVRSPDGPIEGPPRPPLERLDELPYQAHTSHHGSYYTHYPIRTRGRRRFGFIEAGRGCPHSCLFCSQTLRISYGNRVRLRSHESVAAEVEYLVRELDVNALVFLDDAFCLDHRFAHGICDSLIERGLNDKVSWLVQTRVDAVDEDLLVHMREAGCSTVCFGVESGSQRVLDTLRKGVTLDQIRAAFQAAHDAGLLRVGFFMLGNPTETREELESTMAFCRELAPDFIQVAFFTAYPGSAAWAEWGDTTDYDSYTHYNAVISNRSEMSNDELVELHRRFYLTFLSRPEFVARYARYRLPRALANWREEAELMRTALGFFTSPHDD